MGKHHIGVLLPEAGFRLVPRLLASARSCRGAGLWSWLLFRTAVMTGRGDGANCSFQGATGRVGEHRIGVLLADSRVSLPDMSVVMVGPGLSGWRGPLRLVGWVTGDLVLRRAGDPVSTHDGASPAVV
jgi:hypothetical protein